MKLNYRAEADGLVTPDISAHDPAVTMTSLRRVFSGGRTKDARWRIAQLRGIERLVCERESEIAQAIASDLGRGAVEAFLGDLVAAKCEAIYARKNLRRWMRRKRSPLPLSLMPGRGWVQYEPLGVVLIIGPWNYPVSLTLCPLVAAVAAGNCAVVKPSELAPATSRLLARLIPEYLDGEAIAVVEGDGSTTQELLAQGFDHAFFTGGADIGKKVMAGAAAQLTPVTLELGGKSPAIVTKDADLAVTARRIAWAKLINSGQTCIAPDYVLAERDVRDQLVQEIVLAIKAFRVQENTPGMPIVNDRQFDRLTGYLTATKAAIALGGDSDRRTRTIEPTILVDPAPDEPVMIEEIFGPILPVLSVDSLDNAITFVNARPKPLAAYVFTKSRTTRNRVLAEVSSGTAVVNHLVMQFLSPQLPFGGVGRSGMGGYKGKWGFETLSHRKAVLQKPFRPDPRFVYPPYTDRAVKLIRRLF